MNRAKVLAENPTEEQFREIRRGLITGTDIGVILGLVPYEGATPYGLALEKKGLIPPREESEAMWLGKQAEPTILAGFAKKIGRRVRPNRSIFCHPERAWMGGTPDAFVDDPEEGAEAKLVGMGSAKYWGESGSLDVPAWHYTQCQWYMGMTGLDRWWLVPQIGTRLQQHPIDRDPEMIAKMVKAADEFRQRYLLGDEMPEPGADDVSLVSAQFPISQEGVLDETPELRALAEAFAAGRAREAEGKRMAGDARARLELAMGEKEKLKLADGGITWRTAKASTSINYEEVIVEAIDKLPSKYSIAIQKMIPKHTVTKPGARSFRPYGQLFEKEGD